VVACLGQADSLSEKIESGELDSFLLRPISTLWIFSTIQIGDVLGRLVLAIPMLLTLQFIFESSSYLSILQGTVLFLGAGIMNGLLNNVLATLTFWLRESYAFVIFKETLFWMLSGALFPLDLLPSQVKLIVTHLPMAYTIFAPVQFLSGKMNFWPILFGQLLWILMFAGVAELMFARGKQRYQAYGS
jgi:ABC-2 type transport system permease protein